MPQGRRRRPRRAAPCPALLLALLLAPLLLARGAGAAPLAAAGPEPGAGGGTTIDSSVVLLFMSDLEGGEGSLCADMTRRAMETRGRTVSYVVTGYYRAFDGSDLLAAMGYLQSPRDRELRPFTWDDAARLSRGLADCMRIAVAGGFGLAAHIHLDDADGRGTWRNAIAFEPFTRYGALSYFEGLVRPAAEALRDANLRGDPLRLALQAEMGATLFYNARSYANVAAEVRALFARGGTTPPPAVRIGVNVNFEKICGCPYDLVYSTDYFSRLTSRWPEVRAAVNVPDVQRLFRAIDWVGVSAYAPLPADPAPADLEASLARVDRELRLFGVDLRGLGKDLVFSEFGVGGGESADYNTPARTPAAAAAAPYWGVAGAYNASRDPWARPANRAFLRRFYNATLRFAAAGGGPEYRVKGIYLWNIISYDVTGVHYLSTSASGSYRDPAIARAILAHNIAMQLPPPPPPPSPLPSPSPPPQQQQQQSPQPLSQQQAPPSPSPQQTPQQQASPSPSPPPPASVSPSPQPPQPSPRPPSLRRE